ncbi:MAG: 1-acyl-sn-glycerol-3-phosphate acyltransferase [Rhodothermales bacterium]
MVNPVDPKDARIPDIGPGYPKWGHRRLTHFARLMLARFGWVIETPYPDVKRSVVVIAPHTSNWDFIVGVGVALALDIRPAFIGKHTLFRWPLGTLMRRLGGIPVNRKKTEGLVPRVAARIRAREEIVLAIAPEGTRKGASRWRTGFYHIAAQSGIPIVPCLLSLKDRTVQFGAPLLPGADPASDLAQIAAFYQLEHLGAQNE